MQLHFTWSGVVGVGNAKRLEQFDGLTMTNRAADGKNAEEASRLPDP
eukprot:COSAG05_NODE_2779_length_2648_cov_2.420949_2_plen_47_part_00